MSAQRSDERAPTLGEIRDRIVELVAADDKDGFVAYVNAELFDMYPEVDQRGGLARDLRGLVWAVAKGQGWDG